MACVAAIPYLLFTDVNYINDPRKPELLKDSAFCAMLLQNIYPQVMIQKGLQNFGI